MTGRPKFLVLAPSISTNSLGRAVSMAMVARELGDTWLVAEADGPVWPAAGKFGIPVGRLSGRVSANADVQAWFDAPGAPVIWVCKGLQPLPRRLRALLDLAPDARVILDLDDDDAGLSEMFARRSMRNRVTLHPLHQMNPARVRRAQAAVASRAEGFTFSTFALSATFPESFAPAARVPHVRVGSTRIPDRRANDRGVRVGLLGTMRAHKGGHIVEPLLAADASLEVVSFERSGITVSAHADRFHEVPASTPLADVYSEVDVAFIPIDSVDRGARMQLPAKLVDAMSFGVPVVATSTPAILEILGDAGWFVEPTSSLADIAAQLRAAAESDSAAVRRRFDELLTPAAAAIAFDALLQRQLVDSAGGDS